MINVNGIKGTNIVFSCTWKENRKKDREELSNANVSSGNRGPAPGAEASFVFSLGAWRLIALRNSPSTLGKNPIVVNRVASLTRTSEEARFRHLTATLEKHQKLATLSSNRPLENGNIRVIGSRMVLGDENGGRNGRNKIVNVTIVVIARRMNSRRLGV